MAQDAAQDGRDALLRQAALHEMLRGKAPGERIAFLRREKQMSQNGLAVAVRAEGAPCSGKWKVCRWEKGMRPRQPARDVLAKVLGVSESILFDNVKT